MHDKMLDKARGFYDSKRRLYYEYCAVLQELITKILDRNKMNYNNISGRVKSKNSFIEKCSKDKYKHFNEITDLIGIRVISYLLSDVKSICALIESEFHVDYDNSKNKADELRHNEFGYRGNHYVLKLSDNRAALAEYSKYKEICFEIQIKTLPQHTWAEISHDRHYKFKGVMPADISRRFATAAAQLESIDNEFQSISDALDYHADEITAKLRKGIYDIQIDSTSLLRYGFFKFDKNKIHMDFHGKDHEIIDELYKYGLKTLRELENIVPDDLPNKISEWGEYGSNFLTLLRHIMIIHDCTRYFEKSWCGDWKDIKHRSSNNLLDLYGVNVDDLKKKYWIHKESETAQKILSGDLNIWINVMTVLQYAEIKFKTNKIAKNLDIKDIDIVEELAKFGIFKLQELEAIVPNNIIEVINEIDGYSTNISRLIRHLMVIHDAEKFLKMCNTGAKLNKRGTMRKLLCAYNIDADLLIKKYLETSVGTAPTSVGVE